MLERQKKYIYSSLKLGNPTNDSYCDLEDNKDDNDDEDDEKDDYNDDENNGD